MQSDRSVSPRAENVIEFRKPRGKKTTAPSESDLDRILHGAGRSRIFSQLEEHVESALQKHAVATDSVPACVQDRRADLRKQAEQLVREGRMPSLAAVLRAVLQARAKLLRERVQAYAERN